MGGPGPGSGRKKGSFSRNSRIAKKQINKQAKALGENKVSKRKAKVIVKDLQVIAKGKKNFRSGNY